MYFASSMNGSPFGNAQKLGSGTWPLHGCPMDGGSLAIDAQGKILTVWRRDRFIYSATLGGDEKQLGAGAQPVIAMGSNGPLIAWQTKNSIMYSSSSQTFSPLKGMYPALAASSNGAGPVVLVCESPAGIASVILSQ